MSAKPPILNFRQVLRYRRDRPFLLVRIAAESGLEGIQELALLDTGATHCWFDSRIADDVGLDLAGVARETVMTGGGPITGRWASLEIEVVALGLVLRPRVFFSDNERAYPIIGLTGVVDHLVLGLHHSRAQLFLGDDPEDAGDPVRQVKHPL